VPPISLGYLAAALRPVHEVALRDGLRSATEVEELGRGYGAVCVTVSAADEGVVGDLCARAKRSAPAVPVILGGPNVSARGDRVLREVRDADFALVGEAEHTLPLLLEGLERGAESRPWLPSVPGLIWRDGARCRTNAAPAPPDVESLEVAWDLMPPNQYPRRLTAGPREYWPIAPVITSRGCPDACRFCTGSAGSGRVIRRRSLGPVLQEIRLLVGEYGVRGLEILDDNFTGDREYLGAFCDRVAAEFPQLVWCCPNGVRLEAIDDATARIMRRAGCASVSVGIDACLTRAGRDTRLPDALGFIGDKVRVLQGAGIAVDAYALLGVPDEAPEDAEIKAAWLRQSSLRRATFARFDGDPAS
jgi:radical SAM superfamily enzyme YgiQ (UPF0313 family)